MLNTVQHSNTIKVFLSINEEETKSFLKILYKAQLCVTKLFTLYKFLPKNVKNKQKLTIQYWIAKSKSNIWNWIEWTVMNVVRMVIY